jgi:Spherulation-specific family 4
MRVRRSLRPALYAAIGVIVVLIATGITYATVGVQRSSGTGYETVAGGADTPPVTPSSNAAVCEQLVVPAYFSQAYWEAAIHAKHPPADMILDISGVGAGSAPEPEFKTLVKQATAAGITILGYSSTVDGDRPIAQVEQDVQNYKAWYGVTSIFLDRVSGQPAQLSYYKQIDAYVHQSSPGSQVWLNPGVYPDQSYMSAGDKVMVFEGTYAEYVDSPVPSWAKHYSPDRFVHTIYATPGTVLGTALELAQQRGAGHVYVTDLIGSNPYQGLPSYWSSEDADATAGCKGSG